VPHPGETRRVGDVEVSALGLGGAGLGNLLTAIDDDTAAATVEAAWGAGVRFFDTAPHYGLGLAERRLGAALAGRPRAGFAVCTKVGRLLVPGPGGRDAQFAVPADLARRWDFSADGVRASLESSVDRLGLDRVDVVLLHDPDDHWEQALGEAYPVLHELRSQGVIGAIGVGMNQWRLLDRFVAETDVDAVMPAGRYTLLDRSAAEVLLPRCGERGVAVLAAGVFNSGVLASDSPGDTAGATYDYLPADAATLARAGEIARVCAAHGVRLPQAALAYAARHPAVACVVVGAQAPEQVRESAALFAEPVPEALWDDLDARGLVRA
jgi:D-threo-aldose 1-dehydrogenase